MMLKKSWLVALALGAAFTTQAQKANVISASNELRNGSLTDAKTFIDQATIHPETQNWDKTYFYRGKIYVKINGDAELREKTPNALDIAGESFFKCRELDKKGKYTDEIAQELDGIYKSMIDMFIRARDKKDYVGALAGIEGAIKYERQPVNVSDPNHIQLIEIAADYARLSNSFEKAEYYYNQIILSDSVAPIHFSKLGLVYKEQKKNDAYLKTLEAGIAKFPGNYDLMMDEIQVYIDLNKLSEAISKVIKAHELNPKNVVITEVLADAYEKSKDIPNAIKYYQKALMLDSSTYHANVNLAIIIYNEAVKMNEEANKIPPSKQKEYEQASLKVNDKMKSAIPYFEAAVKNEKAEINDKETLRKIYVRLNMMDKASALKKEIDAAKAAKGGAR